MISRANVHADYKDLKKIGALCIDENGDGTDLVSPEVLNRLRVEGILSWSAEALDSLEIFETEKSTPWIGLITRMLPHCHTPFSSHSGAMFITEWVLLDGRSETYALLLRGRDPESGSEDYIVLWSTEEGNTRVLTQRASVPMVAEMLKLERVRSA